MLAVPDNQGTEFIFAFGSNHKNNKGTLEVFVTTRKAGPVAFNYTHDGTTEVGRAQSMVGHKLVKGSLNLFLKGVLI